MMKAIGLFGGTFNPVHHGHLRSALEIYQHLGLSQVTFIPTYMSPHKQVDTVDTHHRLSMLSLAVKHCPQLIVSDLEIKAQKISYTINTIMHFRQRYPDTPLCFLMGMDSFVNFTQWYRWQDILTHCHLIVSARPGYDIMENSDMSALLNQYQVTNCDELQHHLGGCIYVHHANPLAISSSSIRDMIANKQAITYLTPPEVEQYITTEQLYLAN